MKEFVTRTTTAFFLIIVAYSLIKYVPPVYFSIFLFLLISGAVLELIKLTQPRISSPVIIFLNGMVIGSSFTFGKPELMLAVIIILVSTGVFFLFSITQKEQLNTFLKDIGIHFLAVFYLYVPLYFMFKLKELHPHYLFFLLFVIAIGDSAAYFLGKAFGKHKIFPIASPNKSLEGLIAAVIFGAASGWLSIILFPVEVKVWTAIVTGGIIEILSQLSDPVESLFKRAADKKDSGSLLPGHGGILDRVDSYIFCAPVLFYIIRYSW
ncbi:MAG: phosphatidate cytidylyltransferase [Candidatus Aminicenantes bacterium]|nr:MAG: phosphatidate cytidylyltransferase [Candidatus Aminicenantes bacterium]